MMLEPFFSSKPLLCAVPFIRSYYVVNGEMIVIIVYWAQCIHPDWIVAFRPIRTLSQHDTIS